MLVFRGDANCTADMAVLYIKISQNFAAYINHKLTMWGANLLSICSSLYVHFPFDLHFCHVIGNYFFFFKQKILSCFSGKCTNEQKSICIYWKLVISTFFVLSVCVWWKNEIPNMGKIWPDFLFYGDFFLMQREYL